MLSTRIYICNARCIFAAHVKLGMKYFGAILFIILVLAIVVGGTYCRREIVQTSIQLIPGPIARPELVESTLAEYNGVQSVRLSRTDNRLQITFNKARISLEDLSHVLISMGYRVVPLEPAGVKAAM